MAWPFLSLLSILLVVCAALQYTEHLMYTGVHKVDKI